MIRQGEITEIRSHMATVRIYKNEEPTALTVNARFRGSFSVADMVEVEIRTVPFRIYTALSYAVAFVTVFLSYAAAGIFTDNIIIKELVLLAVLLLTYLGAKQFEKTSFFEKVTFCKILGLSE